MNIQDKFWKWKRIWRRNKQTVSRIISVCLTVALVVIVAYAAVNMYRADQLRAAEENKEVEEIPGIVLDKKWDYGESGFQKVAENEYLILEADYTTGEIRVTDKSSNKQWYSNPPDRNNDKVVAIRSRINSQLHVKFINMEDKTSFEYDNNAASIKKGGMTHEKVENGVKFVFAFPQADVYIPVQYTLQGKAFQAEVVTSEIKGVGSNPYVVESIAFLPYFGAGGLEDEGYLFVPDGSGALINFNNNKQKSQNYISQVYGQNLTLGKSEGTTNKEMISLPVFGAKCNDSAYLGVIISGDANSTITASTSRKTSSYNTIYSTVSYREYSLLQRTNDHHAGVETRIIDCSDDLMCGKNYAVRYFFMNGEDANYTGMSKCYREYLEENNLLKDSALADDKYLVLDLIGAVSIEKYIMGIKRPTVTALTTYNDVCNIVKELKERGVDKLIINYVGAMDGGLNNKMFASAKTESVLGSKKEFQAMVDYLKQEGVKLFLETNPVDLYNNGNGYDDNRDAAKTFFDKYAFQYTYRLDSNEVVNESRWHLLQPALVPDLVEKFTESSASWGITNISMSRLAEVLYSHYPRIGTDTTRLQTMELFQKAMQAAGEKSGYVMVHGGNAYCAPYADVIADTASSSSDFDMEDASVPFYQLVFQGNSVLTTDAFNTTVDYTGEFLKALETGCSLKYNLIKEDVSALVGTEYNTMVSYSYDYWKDIIVDEYLKMQKATQQFAGEDILHHEMVDKDVSLTEYESGTIIINYRDEAYNYNGTEIGSREYLIISGGVK